MLGWQRLNLVLNFFKTRHNVRVGINEIKLHYARAQPRRYIYGLTTSIFYIGRYYRLLGGIYIGSNAK